MKIKVLDINTRKHVKVNVDVAMSISYFYDAVPLTMVEAVYWGEFRIHRYEETESTDTASSFNIWQRPKTNKNNNEDMYRIYYEFVKDGKVYGEYEDVGENEKIYVKFIDLDSVERDLETCREIVNMYAV